MVPKIILVCLPLVLISCSSIPSERFSFHDIEPDCSNSEIQKRWIQAQLSQGAYDPNRSEWERDQVAKAKELQWRLQSQCLHPIRPESLR
jgi:hypothetical protein